MKITRLLKLFVFTTLAVVSSHTFSQGKPIRIGVVTFLSGPGAAPFGVPAHNAAVLMFDALNAGELPAQARARGGA